MVKFHSNNAAQNVEKLLEIEKRDRLIERAEDSKKLLISVIVIVVLIGIIISIHIGNRSRLHRQEARLNAQKRLETEITKLIADVTAGQFDQLNNNIYRKILTTKDQELVDFFEMEVKRTKKRNRQEFADILNREDITSFFPLLPKLTEFSLFEKMIFIAAKLELSPDYLSKIFYNSTGSIRGIKSNIRKKIENSDILDINEKNYLLSLIATKI